MYSINPKNYRTRNNSLNNDMQFGFIQINLTNALNDFKITPVIWSRPIPLAWFFGPQWEKINKKWPEDFCNKWLMKEDRLKKFTDKLFKCPCTLEQAIYDKGRFLPDNECDKDFNPGCMYNKGAVHCVRSARPNLDGSEQQCCYDKNQYLMFSQDQLWGSKPCRSHNLGKQPWNKNFKVPTLSQWTNDIMPFYMCCLWQNSENDACENFRYDKRPSEDCVAYEPPRVATVFGDLHFITFDNLMYTFNGKGHFVLVRADNKEFKLDIQGRFEQLLDNKNGEIRATQLTALVARSNNSAIIEVQLRPKDAQWRYKLNVFADGRKIYFDKPALKFQHFQGWYIKIFLHNKNNWFAKSISTNSRYSLFS